MNKQTYSVIYMWGVEGNSLYINDYRVCGPKPWGGGKVLKEWKIIPEDLERAIPGLKITRKVAGKEEPHE